MTKFQLLWGPSPLIVCDFSLGFSSMFTYYPTATVAGPSTLAESVRLALRSNVASPLAVLRGMPSVTLHVETFGMVKA